MTTINVKTNGAFITAKADGKITSGMVGLPVIIEYDDTWNGLAKTLFFRVGNQVRKRINVSKSTTVPWEILRTHGKPLEIGIEGRDSAGNIVMPTIWASVSMVYQGASGEIPAAPEAGDIPSGGGSDGKDGTTFYPTVSDDGVISWTNDGNLPNPEPVNIMGKDGADGNPGVYLGSGDAPEDCSVQIDPDGEAITLEGITPVKGVDYWTPADIAEIKGYVDEAILGGAW